MVSVLASGSVSAADDGQKLVVDIQAARIHREAEEKKRCRNGGRAHRLAEHEHPLSVCMSVVAGNPFHPGFPPTPPFVAPPGGPPPPGRPPPPPPPGRGAPRGPRRG